MTDRAGSLHLASASPVEPALFPIRDVCRLTGINPVTLRAWERRYGLVQPTRTESGHRLYSQADIELIRSVLLWVERGVAVSKVGSILARTEAARQAQVPCSPLTAADEWGEWQQRLRAAVSAFDARALEQIYGQIFSTYPLATVFEQVLMPAWQELLLHKDNFGHASEWLFLDAFLRARVLQRLQLARPPQAARVLLATLSEHCRELELLVAGLLLGSDSVAVEVFAAGLPLEEVGLVCDRVQPQALVLFSNLPANAALIGQLRRLALGLGCPLALAGGVSDLSSAAIAGTAIASLGSSGQQMQACLMQLLAGRLDT